MTGADMHREGGVGWRSGATIQPNEKVHEIFAAALADIAAASDPSVVAPGFATAYTPGELAAKAAAARERAERLMCEAAYLERLAAAKLSDPRDLIVVDREYAAGKRLWMLVDRGSGLAIAEAFEQQEIVRMAQSRKGWSPMDGSPETYARQIAEHGGEAR